jgi:hypothetical protein
VLTKGAYSVIVISTYFQFSEPTERGVERLQKVLDGLNNRDAKDIVISADVNARSASWHDVKTDRRGEIVDEFVTTNGLEIINRGDQPQTFESHYRGSTNLDVTLARLTKGEITDWKVKPGETTSDHALITYRLANRTHDDEVIMGEARRFNLDGVNWHKFREKLSVRVAREPDLHSLDSNTCAEKLETILKDTCADCLRRGKGPRKRPTIWWTQKLQRSLDRIVRVRAAVRTTLCRRRKRSLRAELKKLKRDHRRACFSAKKASWRRFVTEIGNEEPWGPVYRWIKQGASKPSEEIQASLRLGDGLFSSSLVETGERLLEVLVPDDCLDGETAEQAEIRERTGVHPDSFTFGTCAGRIKPCDEAEVKEAIWRMNPRKAPGYDGVRGLVLRMAWPVLAKPITHAFNISLSTGVFPNSE